jgi:predicted transcriptional regulator
VYDTGFSVFDLLDAPSLDAEILVHLTRHGPTDTDTLVRAIGCAQAEVEKALAALVEQGRVRIKADGRAEIAFQER